jgi:hypothetical protein
MNGMLISCKTCGRRWETPLHHSVLVQLELASRSCPHCEACTLECAVHADRPEKNVASLQATSLHVDGSAD